MKKTLLGILTIVIVLLAIIISKYNEYRNKMVEIQNFNVFYEGYLNQELIGAKIATVINKAIDDNESNFIEKNEQGKYLQNDVNSINIEVKITDLEEEVTYDMTTLYSGGMTQFVKYYSEISFKCVDIKYNSQGKVNYMLFEQISS